MDFFFFFFFFWFYVSYETFFLFSGAGYYEASSVILVVGSFLQLVACAFAIARKFTDKCFTGLKVFLPEIICGLAGRFYIPIFII